MVNIELMSLYLIQNVELDAVVRQMNANLSLKRGKKALALPDQCANNIRVIRVKDHF